VTAGSGVAREAARPHHLGDVDRVRRVPALAAAALRVEVRGVLRPRAQSLRRLPPDERQALAVLRLEVLELDEAGIERAFASIASAVSA
jgi:hypothetical protein